MTTCPVTCRVGFTLKCRACEPTLPGYRNQLNYICFYGKMPEWLNGTVSKTVYRLVRYEGSNPSLSANAGSALPSLWLGIFCGPNAHRACSGEREGHKKPHEVRHC
jgi:hypothetical protein